jgi:hypothetical protein
LIVGATREQICDSTARSVSAAIPNLAARPALVGLDGFVDSIISIVDKRYSATHYDPVRTIGAFAEKVRRAAGESSNYELVVKQRKLGGNGPILANALATLGLGVTYVGALGYPARDPAFDGLAQRARTISVAQPGQTDALEFDDGKLMLGKHESLGEVTWERLVASIGAEPLAELFRQAELVGLVNWTMVPQMSQIWSRLLEHVFTPGGHHPGTLFIDLADPEKRTPEDIAGGLALLTRFQQQIGVVLGLNLKEACEVAQVLGLAPRADPEGSVVELAADIRSILQIACVVVHPRRSAAAATEHGAAWFAGPFIERPLISTGAGDHFNAGFCLGRMLGLGVEECLCAGVATSGYYVRTAQSPTAAQLADFVGRLPAPEAS